MNTNKYYLRSDVAFKNFQKVGPIHNCLLVVANDDLDFGINAQEDVVEALWSARITRMVLRGKDTSANTKTPGHGLPGKVTVGGHKARKAKLQDAWKKCRRCTEEFEGEKP